MDEETALKAIDYAKTHSGKTDTLHIGYYGGEPLVNYPVMIKSMRYALETMKNRKLHFAFTTNAVLLTKDKCKELAEIPNLSVTVSLNRNLRNGMISIEEICMEMVVFIRRYRE